MFRVAVWGSGPSGFFISNELMRRYGEDNVEIYMFEKLPTPFGLIRYGVSPEHQKIKSITVVFHKIVKKKNFKFYGNVTLGKDLFLQDLVPYFDAIVIATGANKNRLISVENNQKSGNYLSISFVGWYNGHPDYSLNDFDLSSDKAVIIGNGNVAIDIAKILLADLKELSRYDIPQHVLKKLQDRKIKDVYIVARRGPLQSSFSVQSVKEIDTNAIVIHVEQQGMNDILQAFQNVENIQDNNIKNNFNFLYQQLKEKSKKEKNIHFLFGLSPKKIFVDQHDHVNSIQFEKNQIIYKERETEFIKSHEVINIDTRCVFYATGYVSSEINSIPYNVKTKNINNCDGRVQDENQRIIPYLYTVGWAKRGANGVIGTNKIDAKNVALKIIEDMQNKNTKQEHKTIKTLIKKLKVRPTSYADWEKIEKIELDTGMKNGKIREKIVSISDMLQII